MLSRMHVLVTYTTYQIHYQQILESLIMPGSNKSGYWLLWVYGEPVLKITFSTKHIQSLLIAQMTQARNITMISIVA